MKSINEPILSRPKKKTILIVASEEISKQYVLNKFCEHNNSIRRIKFDMEETIVNYVHNGTQYQLRFIVSNTNNFSMNTVNASEIASKNIFNN
jgi:hypothetical protein